MYYLHFQDHNHGPYVIGQIRSMWASGIITADAVYWSEATSTWESVAELLKPPPSIAAEKEPAIPPLPPAGSNENTAMWDSAKPRPWRRLWARLLDLQILGGIPLLTIALICLHFFPTWPFPNAGFVSGLIALEPLFLSKFGTTPGKWLLGITLKKPDGNNLTQKEAMRRLFSVIWRCILLVFPFCAALAYRDLKKRGATKWDRKGNYVVTYSQISGQRWLAAVSLMFIFTVSSFVSMWELLATERGQPHDLFTGNVQPEGKTDDIRTKANAAADAGLQKVLTRTLSDTKTEAKEWFRKGVAYDLQGDAASALFGYQKAIELDPEFQQAWSAIGVWHLKLKQSEEAIEALKKASALAPEDANTCYQLTSAYAAGGYLNDTNFALHRLEQLNREQAMGLVQSFNIEFVQKLAASEYPDLKVKDSPLNRGFVARYNAYKGQKAAIMEHNDWPIRLAKEAATELRSIASVNAAYPETIVGGSPLSIAINAERDRLLQDNPSYFNDPHWPERLADFCAEQIGVKRTGGQR